MALRFGWGRPRRSHALNLTAWSALIAGELAAMTGAGAWGMAIAALCAMVMAAACLGWAAWTAPAGKATASNRRAHALPEGREPRHIGRRLATFMLTVPAGLIAALLIALAARTLATWLGWPEADGVAIYFYMLPLAWTVLVSWLLMKTRRRSQLLLLALPSLVSAMILVAGGAGQ